MKTPSLGRLLEISGPPLSIAEPTLSPSLSAAAGPHAGALLDLLRRRNGFYAFESALHVFPTHSEGPEIGLDAWNARESWRSEYGDLAHGCLFFAEDVFGCQFAITPDGIQVFDPETGGRTPLADDMERWARLLLLDFRKLTGWPFAQEWQSRHGPMPPGKRLTPKIPFVFGGAFDLDNFFLQDAETGMRFRGRIATRIRDLPDGAEIEFQVID
ncbi:hypothetical protein SAMN06265365_1394 [Tistlia consotensis]|uniref:SMI1/KNR4 family protein n=2 Tax=Tistlia TaxID=1321364 RepID=A0A1Y6CQ65_9PROT|nr:hypothetical protein SAMN05428998_1424 [Tistlia consotensis USBA 355]SNS21520.1 hypothetical protein SAMN06265365_1394 [Tistlia consotensis]